MPSNRQKKSDFCGTPAFSRHQQRRARQRRLGPDFVHGLNERIRNLQARYHRHAADPLHLENAADQDIIHQNNDERGVPALDIGIENQAPNGDGRPIEVEDVGPEENVRQSNSESSSLHDSEAESSPQSHHSSR